MNKYKTIDYPASVGKPIKGKEAVLSVRNLAISFRTDNGYVRAVRGVSFDLYKEETLCIVGESGSGKSVTNKTIMGILPKNSHIDSGSIMYQGEDLTKVSEAEFHRIRGNKIGMIFQDPLSSLNPIMRIGKQITEEMIINGDHLKNYFNELINEEYITYKNDVRLLQIEKEELRHFRVLAKRKKAMIKADTPKGEKPDFIPIQTDIIEKNCEFAQKKQELKAKIGEDKKALAAKKAEARKAVKAKKADIVSRHKQMLVKINEELKARKAELAAASKAYAQNKDEASKEAYEKAKAAYRPYDAKLAEHRRMVSEMRVSKKEAKQRALQIMAEVGIPEPERRFNQYPFEFSGGMRQRIVIAIALTAEPDILICDEPTTALDVTIQAQILELINRLKAKHHMSVIFITHDLGVVANMADRVAVMYAGKIVEYGTAEDVFYAPAHPYTWALLSSIPDVDSKEKLEAIPGTPPNMLFPPKGDAFADRSKYAMSVDYKLEPPMFRISPTHYAATWLLDSRAPEAEMPKIVSTRIANSLEKAGEKQ
ncbi:MAG: ATP-binding cassette domain-containing protein [Bacilli bacterium]|nr:ATP-binding cassette domain-containing protein [Bacilli bacterium]MBO6286925.1 ATP-binding cassette domain-containing protein [Bacilli bacterium]